MFRGIPRWICASALLSVAACGEPPPQPQAALPTANPPAPATIGQPSSAPPIVAVATAPALNPDSELAARVKKALEANAEIAQGVDVSAKDGKVRLWGTVPNRAARRAAEKMAAATPGVSGVENKIVVIKGS